MTQRKPRSSPQPGNARAQAQALVSQTRRALAEHSLAIFVKTYLAAHCTSSPSQMHTEMFTLLEKATTKRGERIAVAAPRGHAKTTLVNTAYILWSICYNKETFIILVSATSDQASDHLSHVKRELETNTRLIEDFPEACEVPGVPPKAPRWRKNEIITRNEVKVTACGEGTSIRGRKYKQHRPSLILIDDLEMRERVFSEEQRLKVQDWFNASLLKMGSLDTNVVMVGTILHYDSLLCGLTNQQKSPGWTGRIYRAIVEWPHRADLWSEWENVYRHRSSFDGAHGRDAAYAFYKQNEQEMNEGALVLWPEHETLYKLMECRESEGRATFDSEKQNEPVNPVDCLFPESDMQFWDDQYACEDDLLTMIGNRSIVIGACDPSLGRAGSSGSRAWGGGRDYSALLMLLWHIDGGTLYVVDANIRHRKPDVIIEDALTLYRRRNCQALGFEVNGFQQVLASQLGERGRALGIFPRIMEIKNHTDKRARVQRLQPLITSGAIRFSRRHTMLLEQLRQFPLGSHDDGPDALEMAVHVADAYTHHMAYEQHEKQFQQLKRHFEMIAHSDYEMMQLRYGSRYPYS